MQLFIVPFDKIPQAENCPVESLLSIYKTCLVMEQVCLKEQGIGLSAVQVGLPWKLYIVQYDKQFRYFVNCEYKPIGEEKTSSLEGCLSLKNADNSFRHFKVDRFAKVEITGDELIVSDRALLHPIKLELDGIYAIVHQHEIDHGLGVTIDQIGVEYTVWKK